MSQFDYDDHLTIATPEGIELSLTLAGVGSRFIAALIDVALQGIVIVALALLLFPTHAFGAGPAAAAAVFAVAFFAVFWGYHVAFEVLSSGRSPGKRWNGLRVVREGGQPIGFLSSAVRNLLRLIDWLPSGYLVGMVAILVSPKNQRLGDMVAGAIVVRELRAGAQRQPGRSSFAAPPGPPSDSPLWDLSAITPDEVATVRRFLERRSEIQPGARYELAATLAARLGPKVAGAPDGLEPERFLELLVAGKLGRG